MNRRAGTEEPSTAIGCRPRRFGLRSQSHVTCAQLLPASSVRSSWGSLKVIADCMSSHVHGEHCYRAWVTSDGLMEPVCVTKQAIDICLL